MTGHRVTETVFNAIKTMLKGGSSMSDCARFTGFSVTTVSYINKANTFEEYKHLTVVNSGRYRAALKNEQEEWEKAEDNLLSDKRTLALNNIYNCLRCLITEQRKTNKLLSHIVDELTR